MNILISDTNIIIDLIELEMFDAFLELPLDIKTTDFVVNIELDEYKQLKILENALANKIEILEADSEQLIEILKIYQNTKGLSLTDCEVYYFSKELEDTVLLSGDKRLRNFAKKNGLDVKGIIWIFDLFEKQSRYNVKYLALKMEELLSKNTRLPTDECKKRINKWKQ